ncbi:hypothetical protein P5V15_005200 [Pogonomyrmex californicus]
MQVVDVPIMTEWYQNEILRLFTLNNVEEKKNVLTNFKAKFGTLDNNEAEQIARGMRYELIYPLLTSNDGEVIEQICDILTILFSILEPGELYDRYPVESATLITNEDANVRLLVLREFMRIALHPEKIFYFCKDTTLLISIVNRIGDNNLNVAQCAMSIIKKVGENPNILRMLYNGMLLRTFAKLLQDDTVSFRIYEVIVYIASTSQDGLEVSAESGFLNSLINLLENEDILLQLNALEMLTQLAVSKNGLNYLEQQEVISKLVQRIAQVDENPLSNLLIPGLMKFFGKIAYHWHNELLSKYPVVVSTLFNVIDSEDQTILAPALDTLGYVCANVEGKYALQALGNAMPSVLKKIAEIIKEMPTDLRIRALNSLALILKVNKDEQDNKILLLTKQWFNSLCDDPLGMIVAICRQPFADIRRAGLEVLAVISSQVWGQIYISTYPGLVEFLLDRNIEAFKECKDVKYEIVECLSQAERNIFDADTMQKFKQFVKEGPFFVDVNTEVAIESAL